MCFPTKPARLLPPSITLHRIIDTGHRILYTVCCLLCNVYFKCTHGHSHAPIPRICCSSFLSALISLYNAENTSIRAHCLIALDAPQIVPLQIMYKVAPLPIWSVQHQRWSKLELHMIGDWWSHNFLVL